MKAIDDNGKIRLFSQLPNVWKNHLNFQFADETLQQEEGFFDVMVPEHDPVEFRLGEIHFDDSQKAFTYELVEIPIETVKQHLFADFETAKRKTRLELLEALVDKLVEINRDKLPSDLIALYDGLMAENQRVTSAIEDMAKSDPAALRKFRIIPEDVEMFTESIKKFKV
jgi:hypothetical protein